MCLSVKVEESILNSVLETDLVSPPLCSTNDPLSSVPCENKIRSDLKMMRNVWAPDDICRALETGVGEGCAMVGTSCLDCMEGGVWESEDWLKQLTISLHKKGSFHDYDDFSELLCSARCSRREWLRRC